MSYTGIQPFDEQPEAGSVRRHTRKPDGCCGDCGCDGCGCGCRGLALAAIFAIGVTTMVITIIVLWVQGDGKAATQTSTLTSSIVGVGSQVGSCSRGDVCSELLGIRNQIGRAHV